MDADDIILQKLHFIYDYMRVQLVEELRRQGHNVTERLINSIEKEITRQSDFVRMDCTFIFYGRFVDTGRKPGGKRVPIFALEEWIRAKNFETEAKKIRSLAFAIQKTIFDKGISQPGTWRGTDTANWMSKTFEKNVDRISMDIEEVVSERIDVLFTNIINEVQTRMAA